MLNNRRNNSQHVFRRISVRKLLKILRSYQSVTSLKRTTIFKIFWEFSNFIFFWSILSRSFSYFHFIKLNKNKQTIRNRASNNRNNHHQQQKWQQNRFMNLNIYNQIELSYRNPDWTRKQEIQSISAISRTLALFMNHKVINFTYVICWNIRNIAL